MIVGSRKPLPDLLQMVEPYDHILILGCGACVTVCMAGGRKEAEETAALLRLQRARAGRPLQVDVNVAERVCEREYVENIADSFAPTSGVQAVISMACGVGTQGLVVFHPELVSLPGLDTSFYGLPVEGGRWKEVCLGCGQCVLHLTGGICPVARCSKALLNGPCGGSRNGKCEVRDDLDCAWQLIWDRLSSQGATALFDEIQPPKDWSAAWNGGPREIIREDVRYV